MAEEEREPDDSPRLSSSSHSKNKEQSRWVMIVPEKIADQQLEDSSPDSQPSIIKLKHPKTESAAQFLICPKDKSIQEILSFQDSKGSWFIDNTVQEDGRLLMATNIDPLFLILPYLQSENNTKKHMFMELDQIVKDSSYPQCNRLVEILDHQTTCQICDSKGNEDFKVYRYSEEKTLAWLKSKVERTADYLSSSDISVSSGQCSSYVRSSKPSEVPREDCLRYAAGLISDYLHPSLSKKMFSNLGIKEETTKGKKVSENGNKTEEETTNGKRRPDENGHKAEEEPPLKKVRKSSSEPDEDYSRSFSMPQVKAVPTSKLTPGQKRLAKADKTGMKSLSSFFKKK
ncbi:putative ribonuclease H2 subunit B-like [Apostichopus japonicus]|uniref:Ribonuclease H2 subunit B n=1 Tax=Stichopus japonicus TaxID=307972 RepID=A0A2G8L678_STIJA|nr:putative ribonuclease H2 subunit B-like [Apostichopus japonicus]